MALAVKDDGNGEASNLSTPVNSAGVPAIELTGVNVSVGLHPQDPSKKVIVIGPVLLVLPFDPDAARIIARGLTGIEIAPAGFSRLGDAKILH